MISLLNGGFECWYRFRVPDPQLLHVKDCGPLATPTNGVVNVPSGTTYGQTATYSCNPGYILTGSATRQCAEDGYWTGALPVCVAIGMYHQCNCRSPCTFYKISSLLLYKDQCLLPTRAENMEVSSIGFFGSFSLRKHTFSELWQVIKYH